MELESQKAELLRVLHDDYSVYLGKKDFRSAQRVTWASDTPRYVKSTWQSIESGLKSKVALEEPTTGYFFAANYDKKGEKWQVIMAPGEDDPRPIIRVAAKDNLLAQFREWAGRIASELGVPRPWSETFRPGDLPLTLRQTSELYKRLVKCGLVNLVTLKTSGSVRLRLEIEEFFFEISREWQVRYQPGELTNQDIVEGISWEGVLDQIEFWARNLRREDEVSFPIPPDLEAPGHATLRLRSLLLENVRAFRSISLNFDGATNLFCGENGSGKSTILRSLSIALCHEADTAALVSDVPGELVTLGEEAGVIEAVLIDAEGNEFTNRVELGKNKERDIVKNQSKEAPEAFLCGYGSVFSLLAQQTQSEYSVRDATRSLFVYETRLLSLEIVLHRIRDQFGDSRYEQQVRSLSSILSLKGTLQLRKGGGIEIVENGKAIPFDGLADGYRVSFSWLVDFLGWAMSANAMENGQAHGILLVDEVDKHMHPSVQATLVEKLEKALPEVQKIFTSHNPLTILGARPESIFVLEDEGSEEGVKCHHAPDFRGYSVEDVYTDPKLFDTEPYSPELQRLREDYEKLAKIDKSERSEEENEELIVLASRLRSMQML